jgi:hypothetical protein
MTPARARTLVLRFLASKPDFGQVSQIHEGVEGIVGREAGQPRPGITLDGRRLLGHGGRQLINEVIWDLIVERVLTVEGDSANQNLQFLRLTEFGWEVVKEQRWSPHDPDGYLKQLAERAPKLAKLCEMYIIEALTCFRGGAYLATAVMLGAASEGNVLDLLNRYHAAMTKARMPERSGYQDKVQKARSFYEKYQIFRRYFDPIRPKLPGRLVDDWEGQMDGVLHLIRNYRNEAGHPTGTRVERTGAFRTLALFGHYCERIEQVGDWLESNTDKLTP